ncbi:hypothetical protein [Pedobacter ginsengisoli]|uniref:hypothetical protein n=1 Tax=Pedobacter ginsengisoli TaxID=363852 RepID=UPI00254F5FB0|nr:hypothetical protein [Pedobacter ginsengisoli]
MAKLDGKFLRGMIGPVVNKKYRGIQVITQSPRYDPNKRTEPSKKAAVKFGVASNLAASIRGNFYNVIVQLYDGPMINRLLKEVRIILGQSLDQETDTFNFDSESFSRLNGFEFNEESPVRDNLFVQPATMLIGQNLQVQFPDIHIPRDLKFPKTSNICMLGVAVGMYDLSYGRMILSPVQSVEIINSPDGVVIPAKQFDFEIEPGCLCIVVISLQYLKTTFAGKMLINDKQFSPCGILSATIAGGQVDELKTKHWKKMDFGYKKEV